MRAAAARQRARGVAAFQDDVKARIEPFEPIEIDLAALWADAAVPTRASEVAAEYGYL